MKNLRFLGKDDVRELSPADLQKLGVEDAEYTLSFRKNESTTVEDDVADAIMNSIVDIREATEDELKQEELDLEAELGFKLYDPSAHTVEEVSAELAVSPENRRKYILDQEQSNKNRKGVFAAVGAEHVATEDLPGELVEDEGDKGIGRGTGSPAPGEEAAGEMAEAGGTTQTTGDSGGPSGTANTSSSAT